MHDTRDAVHFAHQLDPRMLVWLERGIVMAFLAGLVAVAFAFPYL